MHAQKYYMIDAGRHASSTTNTTIQMGLKIQLPRYWVLPWSARSSYPANVAKDDKSALRNELL